MTPTTEQFSIYQVMFDHFNRELFAGQLPHVILNFSRDLKTAVGYYSAKRWESAEQKVHGSLDAVDEITLNPDHLKRGRQETASTLVHEMVHLWQNRYGKPSRAGYHNKEWADKMEAVGLMPSSTGKPGGRRVGQRITHYIAKGGAFLRSFEALPLALPFQSEGREKATKKYDKTKVKYSCGRCRANAWGKPGLQITCTTCKTAFVSAAST